MVGLRSYEALLGTPISTLNGLFKALGLEHLATNQPMLIEPQVYSGTDDLRAIIENFHEVYEYLATHAPCLLPHLNTTNPATVHPFPECRSNFTEQMLEQQRKHLAQWETLKSEDVRWRTRNDKIKLARNG